MILFVPFCVLWVHGGRRVPACIIMKTRWTFVGAVNEAHEIIGGEYWKEDRCSKEIVLLIGLDGDTIGDVSNGCVGRPDLVDWDLNAVVGNKE